MEQKYSDWFKIDLHIHTDKSEETKEGDYKGNFSVDTLKTKLKENEVKIFSLTDHNIVNVKAYKAYYDNYDEKEDPLLLLGVELDIQGSTEKYHSLLIFNHSDIQSVESISEKLEKKYLDKSISDKKQRVLSIEDIVDIFEKEDFFFIPHAGSEKSIVKAYKDDIQYAQQMVILMQSAIEKVTKDEQIRQYNKRFDLLLPEDFRDRKDIAYINFSDNHNCNAYPKSHKGENDFSLYYIKGTKSYESIRLAFVDPESRIKSPEEYQKIDKTNNIVEKIKIDKNKSLTDTEIHFSPHLNAIIGGRSSGKSLLMWIIGNKIDGVNPSKKDYNVELDKVSLKTKNDSSLKDSVSLGNSYLYLEQGDIIKYFEEKKLNELAAKAGKKDEYDRARNELVSKKNELNSFVESLTRAYEDAYNNNSNQFVFHQRVVENVISNKDCVVKFDLAVLIAQTEQYEDAITLLSKTLNNLEDIKKLSLINLTPDEIIAIENTEGIFNDKIKGLQKTIERIKQKNRFVNEIKEVVDGINSSLNERARQKIADKNTINEILDNIGVKLSFMSRLKKSSDNIEKYCYSDARKVVLDDISLVISIKTDTDIKNALLEGINGADNAKSLYLNLCDLLASQKEDCVLKNFKDNTPISLKKKVKTQMEDIFKNIENPIDYLEYQDGSNSSGKSPGFNSEQYIKIVLGNPEIKVVFIDQPEDNLGNQFISKELVNQIRSIKYKKQIFLVTHNPSIVIYGDAESIILAENNKNSISYKQLSLEDKKSQEEICNVLDGGRYIFNNRAQKYNIHRLNIENDGKTLSN